MKFLPLTFPYKDSYDVCHYIFNEGWHGDSDHGDGTGECLVSSFNKNLVKVSVLVCHINNFPVDKIQTSFLNCSSLDNKKKLRDIPAIAISFQENQLSF